MAHTFTQVYVADTGKFRLAIYGLDGVFVRAIGRLREYLVVRLPRLAPPRGGTHKQYA